MTEKRGYQPTPLDFRLLEMLPEVGMVGGVHWRGRRVKDMVPELAVKVSVGTVQARLQQLRTEGLVRDFPAPGSRRIWARTAAGTAYMGNDPTAEYMVNDKEEGK